AVSVTETIDLAVSLFPEGSLVVLGDGTHTFQLNADLVRRDLAEREFDRQVRFYPAIRVSELPALAASLRPTDAVLLISSVLEDDGTVADYWRAGGLVSSLMPTPVFSLWDFFIGTGVAGGLLVSGREQGVAAAELATEILAGAPADAIPVIVDSPNRWIFDMGVLGPAGVRASDLPRGARLVNRRLMIWHAYRAAVLVASFILVSMAILISLLIMNIRRRSQVAGRLRESLLEKEVLLKEIHHRVKNNLQVVSSMLNIQSGLVRDRRSLDYFKDCESRVYSMALVHDQLYQSDTLTRIAMRDYMEDLVTTLYGVLAVPSDRLFVDPEVVDLFLDIDRAIPVGLVVNELLSNALRYAYPAGEGTVRLRIERSEDAVRIAVRDWGVGMHKGWEHGETLGLNLVRALAQQLGGAVEFYDAGPGLEVQVRFPACDPP
ncbi:MAG: ATP-binding protein, partial [Spirochaetales bacterium]|nr:ATP-binding protein [Spirochaetales bacterium]